MIKKAYKCVRKKKKKLESSRETRQLKGWKMTLLMPVANFVKQHMLPSTSAWKRVVTFGNAESLCASGK